MKLDDDIINELAIQIGLKCDSVRTELTDMKYDALTGMTLLEYRLLVEF